MLRKRRGAWVSQLEGEKAVHKMENNMKVYSLFPMKSCSPEPCYPTKHSRALEVPPRRDLHYELGPLKEEPRGA